MRVFRLPALLLLLVTVSSFAQSPSSGASGKAASGFSIDNIDKTADPCVDFYQYACGNWLKKTEIPADRSAWASFTELDERNIDIERGILEKAAASSAKRDGVDQRIGDLYGSCMDEKAVNAKGFSPIKPELDRIAAAQDKEALIDELAHLYLVGAPSLFSFYSNADLHNADMVIANVDQGGLSLPDRDYYIKDDARMVDMRKHLVDYVTEEFTLAGQSPEQYCRRCENSFTHRDGVGSGIDGPDRAPGSEESRPQDVPRRSGCAGPEFYAESLFRWGGRAELQGDKHRQPGFFPEGERYAGYGIAGFTEGVC